MNLRLDWCSHEAAVYACEHWHYSRSPQPGKAVRVGVWEDGVFVGVILFTMGSGGVRNWAIGGLTKLQIAELARIALQHHKTPVSRLIRIAVKLLMSQSPGLRMLVSYADPAQGHHGGVYQASGWVYVGDTEPSVIWSTPDGEQLHSREVSQSGFARYFGTVKRVWRQELCTRTETPAKHKYVLPLDDEIRRHVELLAKPYPKRVRSETGDTADVQSAKGGSTPTRTLQNSSV